MTVRETLEILFKYPLDAEVSFEEDVDGRIDIYVEGVEARRMN